MFYHSENAIKNLLKFYFDKVFSFKLLFSNGFYFLFFMVDF